MDLFLSHSAEEESLFELATERLPDMGSYARLEALNPPENGAACNFEQIDADRSAGATTGIPPVQKVQISEDSIEHKGNGEEKVLRSEFLDRLL